MPRIVRLILSQGEYLRRSPFSKPLSFHLSVVLDNHILSSREHLPLIPRPFSIGLSFFKRASLISPTTRPKDVFFNYRSLISISDIVRTYGAFFAAASHRVLDGDELANGRGVLKKLPSHVTPGNYFQTTTPLLFHLNPSFRTTSTREPARGR